MSLHYNIITASSLFTKLFELHNNLTPSHSYSDYPCWCRCQRKKGDLLSFAFSDDCRPEKVQLMEELARYQRCWLCLPSTAAWFTTLNRSRCSFRSLDVELFICVIWTPIPIFFWRFWVNLGWFCRVISNQTKLGDPSLSLPKILYHTATPGISRKGPFMIDRGVRGTRENWPRVLPPLLPLLPCLTDWAVMHMSLSCGNFAQSSIAGLQHIQTNQTRIESKYWKQLRYCPSTNYQRLNTDQGKPYASILPWQPWRTPRQRERQG